MSRDEKQHIQRADDQGRTIQPKPLTQNQQGKLEQALKIGQDAAKRLQEARKIDPETLRKPMSI